MDLNASDLLDKVRSHLLPVRPDLLLTWNRKKRWFSFLNLSGQTSLSFRETSEYLYSVTDDFDMMHFPSAIVYKREGEIDEYSHGKSAPAVEKVGELSAIPVSFWNQ
jgi:hypothetical protein